MVGVLGWPEEVGLALPLRSVMARDRLGKGDLVGFDEVQLAAWLEREEGSLSERMGRLAILRWVFGEVLEGDAFGKGGSNCTSFFFFFPHYKGCIFS